jgi:L-iditol 2-dehydrogenase
MKAAVLEEIGVIRIREHPKPACGPDEIIVKQRRIGICGSDIHFWKLGRISSAVLKLPTIIGHESSGEVVGEHVTHLKVGDRVTPEPGYPCGECFHCRLGNYNLCINARFQGAPGAPGCQVEYLVWPALWTYRLPDHLSFSEGALVEPLTVAHFGARRGRLKGGERVLITGAGTIGLCAVQVSAALGAARIMVSDPVPERLDKALSMGASDTISLTGRDFVDAVTEMTDGLGADVTIECSGAAQAACDGILATRRGGRVVLVGMFHEDAFALPVMHMVRRSIALIPSFRYANAFKPTLDMMAAGRFPHARDLITHCFPIEEVQAAFVHVDEKRDGAIKCMLTLD